MPGSAHAVGPLRLQGVIDEDHLEDGETVLRMRSVGWRAFLVVGESESEECGRVT